MSLVFNGNELSQRELDFIEDIYSKSSIWHSVWVNFLPGATNTIFGSEWNLLYGEEDFWQELLGIEFCFHPSCFSQAHLSMFEEMLHYVAFLVPNQSRVLELYAGVGCIGLYLAQKSSKTVFVESSPKAGECFKKTLSKLPFDVSSKCSFFSSPVEDIDFSKQEIDVLIVDPPRKGLSKKCKEKIETLPFRELIYISCGPSSFMRDCEEFLKKGWILDQAKGFLLFPGTDHAEIIAKFVRS
ncbi:MAG: methyltransferase [Verrucomicrobia bacterium]|nr:methyltransferase [Verrucomicrobiota bacterium]